MRELKPYLIGVIILMLIFGVVGFVRQPGDVGANSIRQTMKEVNLLVATSSDIGTTGRYDVSAYRHVNAFVSTEGSYYGTIKVKGSAQDDVNFSAAQSNTNRWDYVQSKLLDTGATVNGVTGYAFTGTDDHRLYEINTNYLKNIAIEVATTSAGTSSVWISAAND